MTMPEYLYNPKDKDLIRNITEDHPELTELLTPDSLTMLRYVIYMYDLNSPFRVLYPDYPIRKRECAIEAGFKIDPKSRRFPEETEDTLAGMNATANKVITRYLLMQNDPNLLLYTSFCELLAVEMENSLKEKDPKIIKFIRENILKLGEAIAKLEESIFGGKEVAYMRRALYSSMMTEGGIPRPESIAKAIALKKTMIGVDPYHGA